eukprot:TRINITY_DN709_c0_g3_i2.p1 TRINITY_DN709_c0_g3~~TRINITY_DN709_c0_g3_i2.p1  ORF type:complete len:342 (-),score=56.25 TRINITY_DN709_c0_g3_i2:313-1338(-)
MAITSRSPRRRVVDRLLPLLLQSCAKRLGAGDGSRLRCCQWGEPLKNARGSLNGLGFSVLKAPLHCATAVCGKADDDTVPTRGYKGNNHGTMQSRSGIEHNDGARQAGTTTAGEEGESMTFMQASKILFSPPKVKKRLGLDFQIFQFLMALLPPTAVFLVAQLVRADIRRWEREIEEQEQATLKTKIGAIVAGEREGNNEGRGGTLSGGGEPPVVVGEMAPVPVRNPVSMQKEVVGLQERIQLLEEKLKSIEGAIVNQGGQTHAGQGQTQASKHQTLLLRNDHRHNDRSDKSSTPSDSKKSQMLISTPPMLDRLKSSTPAGLPGEGGGGGGERERRGGGGK